MAGVVLAVAGAASALRAWEPDSAAAPISVVTPVATSSQPRTTAVNTTPGAEALPFDTASAAILRPGTQASIGYDTVVYYSPLGVGKGAPLSKIFRAYRGPDGQLRTEELLERHGEQFGGPLQSIAVDFERGRLLVAACITGQCGYEGSTPAEGAHFRMFESRDGGVSFRPVGELPPSDLFLLGFVDDEVLALSYGPLGSGNGERAFLFPSMLALEPPAGIAASPVPDGAGGILWRNDEGYYSASGMKVLRAGGLDVYRVPLPHGFLAHWRRPAADEAYLGVYGTLDLLEHIFRVHAETFMTGSQLPNGMLAGTVRFGEPYGFGVDGVSEACKSERPIYPALLNPETGAVHPIIELGGCESGHLGLHALIARPFVRVVTGGDCLNVRAEPSTAGASLGCFADGVLLPVRDAAPSEGWIAVTTPDGEGAGWAAEEFVER